MSSKTTKTWPVSTPLSTPGGESKSQTLLLLFLNATNELSMFVRFIFVLVLHHLHLMILYKMNHNSYLSGSKVLGKS